MPRKRSTPKAVLPPNYFKEALESLIGKPCPIEVPRYGTTGMADEDILRLQDWCSDYAKPSWATGLSMIEASELIVQGAVENGNIPSEE